MDRRAGWILGIVFGGLFLCLFAFLALTWYAFQGERGSSFSSSPRSGVVEGTGPIVDSKKTLKELREFADADSIKAIVVRVDSPGGAVGPSQEIYEAVRKLRDKKHVIVSMGPSPLPGATTSPVGAKKSSPTPGR